MEYFITSSGIPVHISDNKKDGSAILFLHGYLETLYVWDDFTNLFTSNHRIISIDLPGHGLSGFPSDGFDLDFSSHLIHQLLFKLHIDKCHIITHNCGFYIGSHFSTLYPNSVFSLTSISSNHSVSSSESLFIHSLKSSLHEGTFMRFVSHFIPQMYSPDNLRACDDKIQETIAICETHDPEGIIGFSDIVSQYVFRPMSIPFLSIRGQFSIFGSQDFLSSDIVIASSGMNPFIEMPSVTYNKITDFLLTIENC